MWMTKTDVVCKKCKSKIEEKDHLKKEKLCRKCYNKMRRDYSRRKKLKVKNRQIYGIDKRKETGYCEICRKIGSRLYYHHWDEKNPNRGIWICHRCHMFVEVVDDGYCETFLNRYLKLKKKVNSEVPKYKPKPPEWPPKWKTKWI